MANKIMSMRESYNRLNRWMQYNKNMLDGNPFVKAHNENMRKALERQVSRKIIDNHHCPNCGFGLPSKGITDEWCSCCFKMDYCHNCGQKLDWSDEK